MLIRDGVPKLIPDHYEVLEVSRGASADEVRAAHRAQSKRHHPDLGGNPHFFRMVQQAYEVLSDQARRAEYDGGGAETRARQRPEDESQARRRARASESRQRTYQPTQPPFDGSTMSWWSSTGPVPALTIKPRFAAVPLNLLRAAALFPPAATVCLLLVGLVLNGGVLNFVFGSVIGAIVIGLASLPYAIVCDRDDDWAFNTIGWVAACVVHPALAVLLLLHGFDNAFFAAVLVLMVLGALGLRAVQGKESAVAGVPRLTRKDYTDTQVFGAPGGALDTDVEDLYGAGKLDQGILGERLSGAMIEQVLRIPGSKVFHSVRWPGRKNADVDHVLVCGRRVLVMDSKMWRAGRYSVDSYGDLLRDGEPFAGGKLTFSAAVDAYRKALPAHAQVQGLVVLHAATPGNTVVDLPPTYPVRVVAAADAYEAMGAWLAPGAGAVDTAIVSAVAQFRR